MNNQIRHTHKQPAPSFFVSGTPLEQLPDGYFLLDTMGRILDHNPAFAGIFSKPGDRFCGFLLEDFEPVDFRGTIARDLHQVAETGSAIKRTKWRYKRLKGDTGVLEASVAPALDDDGNRAGWMGIVRNLCDFHPEQSDLISEKDRLLNRLKELENQLEAQTRERLEAEKAFRRFFNNAQVGLFRIRMPDGGVEEANEKLVQMFGFEAEEKNIKKLNVLDAYMRPGQRDAYLKTLAETGRIEGAETRLRKKNGSVFWVRFSAKAIHDLGWIEGVVEDITHQKRMEEALKKSEAKYKILYAESRRAEEVYRGLLNSSADAIVIYDLDGNARYINPRFTEIFGWRPTQVLGKPIPFLPESRKEEQDQIIRNLIEKGEPSHGVVTTRRTKDDRTLDVSQSASIYRDPDGTVAGILVLLRDISETRRLETQLIQAQKMEAIGTLAGGIAHDFNNILQAIQGYTQLLLMRGQPGSKDAEKLMAIQNAAQRASNLTRRLLIFSRKMESELRVINLNQEVQAVVRLLERTIPKMIRIHCDLEENLYRINGDPLQLEQLMMNMGVNARDAMPDGGILLFETRNLAVDDDYAKTRVGLAPGLYVRLGIRDTGMGMEKEVVEQIFEPFFTTKDVGKGTGLGLAMVYGAVKNHKGAIICESEPGKGTRFDIFFPALKSAPKTQADPAGIESALPKGNETILLIDDEKNILDILENALKNSGYATLKAENGETAVQLLENSATRIHLAVLDLSMPGMGGIKCLKALRRISPDLKVIVSSGYANFSRSAKTTLSDISAFIGKPYDLRQLLRTIRNVLDG